MDSTQTLVAILGALGIGAAVLEITKGSVRWFNGSAGRERIRNTSLKQERDMAWGRARRQEIRGDREARNRNRMEEYASVLRRNCIDHGISITALPVWPSLEKAGPDERDPDDD